jgi:hypothetical protein
LIIELRRLVFRREELTIVKLIRKPLAMDNVVTEPSLLQVVRERAFVNGVVFRGKDSEVGDAGGQVVSQSISVQKRDKLGGVDAIKVLADIESHLFGARHILYLV